MYGKLSKCDFCKDIIQYLGHIISKEGISMDPYNIEHYELAYSKKCDRCKIFMGLAGYYRRFIEGFSKVSHAITSLQKKGINFEWTSRCEESFQ